MNCLDFGYDCIVPATKSMRHRLSEPPPAKDAIDSILKHGAAADQLRSCPQLLRRLRTACFLDDQNLPLFGRKRLVEQYKKDGLVLFLGAGVSIGSHVPSWPELSDALLLKSGVARAELATVKKALPSYIAQFELAAQRLGPHGFVQEIHRGLYDNLNCKPQVERIPLSFEDQKSWGDKWDDVLKGLQANKTLATVGDFLFAYDGSTPRRNPQIHAILTSNADNLLELYCLAKTRGRRMLTLVDRASVGEHPNHIPVYHLHGSLDARGENVFKPAADSVAPGEAQAITRELPPDLTFGESKYYETIANPFSFVNHTPESFLRRLNALFIGTSLDDLNMRRWLYDSFRERVLHRTTYLRELHERQYLDAKYEAELASRRHFWLRPEVETDKDGRWRVPKEHVECVMHNLGVQVIWCTDYDDMRACIDEVRREGDNPGFGQQPARFPI